MWSPLIDKYASHPLPSPPSVSLCFTVSLSLFLPNIHKHWHELNQHKWGDELMAFTAIFVLITRVLTSEPPLSLRSRLKQMHCSCAFVLSLFTKPSIAHLHFLSCKKGIKSPAREKKKAKYRVQDSLEEFQLTQPTICTLRNIHQIQPPLTTKRCGEEFLVIFCRDHK